MIKEVCNERDCLFYGKYCRNKDHAKTRTSVAVVIPKVKKPIPKESAERKEANKEYKRVKQELKAEQPTCLLKIKDVCTNTPVYPQHIKGRVGGQFTKKEDMIMACNDCNRWVMENPRMAKALGFEASRLEHSDKRKHLYQ